MASTKLGLISEAFVLLGEAPVSDLDAETNSALIASNLFDTIYENALSIEHWHFAAREVNLSRLSADTNNDYAYAFQLPADFLSLTTINQGKDSNNFDVYGDKLYADSEEVLLLYVAKVAESLLPAWFSQYVIYSLAKGFSIPLTDSTNRIDIFANLENRQLSEARFINSTQAPIDGFYTLSDFGHSEGSRTPTRS